MILEFINNLYGFSVDAAQMHYEGNTFVIEY